MIIKKYDIHTKKEIEEQKIAIMSDLHLENFGWDEKNLEIIKTLDKINPTSILIPGDLYNTPSKVNDYLKTFLNSISDIAEVFYIPGNSEIKNGFIPVSILENKNPRLHILGNFISTGVSNAVINSKNMSVAGVELKEDFYYQSESNKVEMLLTKYKNYIEKLSTLCQDETFNILLCHDPIIIKAYEELQALSKFDLVVSGHNHGGIAPEYLKPLFKVLGLDLEKLYPTFVKGIYEKNQTNFIVSEGVTKYQSEFGPLKALENFHEGTIEVVRVRKKDK